MSSSPANSAHIQVKAPYLQLVIVLLGSFMAILDTSVVNVAIPKMEVALNTNTSSIQWVLTGYMLVTGIIVPTSGWLIDTLGPKKLLIFSLIVFTVASALCGVAWNLSSIIAFRILQAIGGGLLQPVAQTIIYRIFPRERIGAVMGLFGVTIMAAPAFGPLLSGYFVEYSSWRLIFFVNVPIGIVAIFMAIVFMHEFSHEAKASLDVLGLTLSTIGFFALLYGFNNVPDHGWGSTIVRGSVAVGAVSLICLVITELRVKNPLLQLRVLTNYTYTVSLIIVSLLNVALFVGIFLLPLYLQNIMGYTPMRSGMFMTPAALASAVMMPISGRLFDKIGARPLGLIGLGILTVSTFGFTFLTTESTSSHIQFLYIVRSVGMGLAMMPIMTAGTTALVAVAPQLVSQAAAVNNTVRQVASGLGTALLTVYMSKREIIRSAQLSSQMNPGSPQGLQLTGLTDKLAASGLSPAAAHSQAISLIYARIQKNGFVLGMNDTFFISTILAGVAWAITIFIYRGKRQKRPAPVNQARGQQQSLAVE
ncbi:DHA2 family efflux MFS transporter permease subunit [Alicyclobacillus fastidiosus]|uniref:DHA2 family efflux MFS transporter permease subunit n=1 Tax=Alicyclobacillus fastidiosus TaxID=392011 RepID=A0ABY6ZGS6_9BACL|nr:DHA2 family efflux MFS transporter permease subunit [Alicyclobacillus fastidiosus]WAH41793.1 DHA2 family efflux MFS transporter permease subunit [Alicyclobacillus fastidiosus]GMA63488.1 MFS transporter [Alicyclobacillus fastidiosus]